jgi:hypothetical protein
MTLNILICGREMLTVSKIKETLFFTWIQGDPASLVDSVRYYSVPEATFAGWFSVTPANTPCLHESYYLTSYHDYTPDTFSVVETVWSSTNKNVELVGTPGTLILRIDKTMKDASFIFQLVKRTNG